MAKAEFLTYVGVIIGFLALIATVIIGFVAIYR